MTEYGGPAYELFPLVTCSFCSKTIATATDFYIHITEMRAPRNNNDALRWWCCGDTGCVNHLARWRARKNIEAALTITFPDESISESA